MSVIAWRLAVGASWLLRQEDVLLRCGRAQGIFGDQATELAGV